MLRRLRRWCHRPAIRMGSVDNSRIHTTRTQNAQFISYLVESGFRQVNPDRYEVSLRRRRWAKGLMLMVVGAAFAWIIIESAKAFTIF